MKSIVTKELVLVLAILLNISIRETPTLYCYCICSIISLYRAAWNADAV